MLGAGEGEEGEEGAGRRMIKETITNTRIGTQKQEEKVLRADAQRFTSEGGTHHEGTQIW